MVAELQIVNNQYFKPNSAQIILIANHVNYTQITCYLISPTSDWRFVLSSL